jgi:DNA-binding GntR family transcriptional regulator
MELIVARRSPRMLAAHSDLYDQAYRYRRLMMAGFPDPEVFLAEHDRLADLALRRAQPEASAALETHIASSLRHVYREAGRALYDLRAAHRFLQRLARLSHRISARPRASSMPSIAAA